MAHQDSQMKFDWDGNQALLSREEWISACHFLKYSDKEILSQVRRQVIEQDNPVVLLDLDSTLYDVGHRSFHIFLEWADSRHSHPYPWIRDGLLKMTRDQMGYSVEDTLKNLKLWDEKESQLASKDIQKFWFQRFFTNEYLSHDQAYAGASQFVNDLYALGSHIVYLTGRDEPGMGKGTRINLERDGFPHGLPKIQLMMKPLFHLDDLVYKKSVVEKLSETGRLIASFENEPPNVVAFSEQFPDAMHIFVDTVCSETPARVKHGLFRLKSYE